MKKIALASVLAAVVAMPALAEEVKAPATAAAPVAATTTTTTAPATAAAPAAATTTTTTAPATAAAPATTTTTTATTVAPAAGTKAMLKDGTPVQIMADGAVKISKDAGKTWMDAPDGTWETVAGTKLVTKGGKEVK